MSESLNDARPPDDFWREVPCGHPPDPVAAFSDDHWVCHCGWILDGSVTLDVIDGHRIKPCGKCGCYPGIPVDHPESDRG